MKLYSTPKATNNRVRGAFIVRIDGRSVFTKPEAIAALRELHDRGTTSFVIEVAPEKKPSAEQRRRAAKELDLFSPAAPPEEHVHQLSVDDMRSISSLLHPDLDFSESNVRLEPLRMAVDAIRSSATTAAEQSLSSFTRRKLKRLDTWPQWKAGEKKQLDQFYDLKMYGSPSGLYVA